MLHNAYRQRGGEDAVVEAEYELLTKAGHNVRLEIVRNSDFSGAIGTLRTLATSSYSRPSKRWLKDVLASFAADVVHVHNFFPLLTPAVHEAANEAGVPVVQTLHNYRLICAGAQLLRDNEVCELCVGGKRLWGVVHRCYRNSVVGSLAVTAMQERAWRHGTWSTNVQRFIALTDFAKAKFVEGGLPAERIEVKSNFVTASPPTETGRRRQGALFVGRLSSEKGVDTLLEAWRGVPDHTLTVVGDGPQADLLKSVAPQNVVFLGQRDRTEVAELMQGTRFLVVPSRWYEGFPMTVVEGFAAGAPIIASRIGSLAEIVRDGENGYLFNPNDPVDLRQKARRLLDDDGEVHRLSLGTLEALGRYSPETSLRRLEEIYHAAQRQLHTDRHAAGRAPTTKIRIVSS